MTSLGGEGWCDLKMALRVNFKYRGVCIYTYFVVAYFVYVGLWDLQVKWIHLVHRSYHCGLGWGWGFGNSILLGLEGCGVSSLRSPLEEWEGLRNGICSSVKNEKKRKSGFLSSVVWRISGSETRI